ANSGSIRRRGARRSSARRSPPRRSSSLAPPPFWVRAVSRSQSEARRPVNMPFALQEICQRALKHDGALALISSRKNLQPRGQLSRFEQQSHVAGGLRCEIAHDLTRAAANRLVDDRRSHDLIVNQNGETLAVLLVGKAAEGSRAFAAKGKGDNIGAGH